MALKLTLELEDLTVEKLTTFVTALEAAGARPGTLVELEGDELVATVNGEPRTRTETKTQQSSAAHSGFDPVQLGDAALNSLIDTLISKRSR